MAKDLCRRLAAMCRQYNDYGSIVRDRAEVNLNSVNFPEFHEGGSEDGGEEDGKRGREGVEEREEKIKEDLFFVAEYEREGLKLAVGKLEEMLGGTTRAWKLFVDVTDLYGQIYVAKDIASRMK